MSSTNIDEADIGFEQANIEEEALVEAYDASYLVSGNFTDNNENLHDEDNNKEVHIDGNDCSTLFDEEAVNSSRNNNASIHELITSATQKEIKKNNTNLERQISDLLERVRFLEGNESIYNCTRKSIADEDDVFEPKRLHKKIDPATKYPRDFYSLIALNGPKRNGLWANSTRLMFFLFGILVFIFQASLLVLSIWSTVDWKNGTVGESGNPDEGFWPTFIPPNTNSMVRLTQILSILVFVVFPEASLRDVARAIHMFPWSYADTGHQLWSLRLSCFLRLVQGILAIMAVWLLVMTSDAVVDIILNFAAINFISNVDDLAFQLAESGVFGPALKDETSTRIRSAKLPACVQREKIHIWYWRVMASTFLFLFGFMIFVFVNQDSSDKWVTTSLRVEFKDKEFKKYSGCYDLNETAGKEKKRYTYYSKDQESNIGIGYCRNDRQWMFFDANNDTSKTACDARIEGLDIVRSTKTDSFDISSSFEETWVSSSGAPLELFFFDSDLREEELYCDFSLGDGICNVELNFPGYSFDEGDCCAATCALSNCGRENQKSAFNDEISPQLSFPHCNDPDMVPLTIHFNEIKSSRHEHFINETSFKGFFYDGETMDDIIQRVWDCDNQKACNVENWRAETPKKPYFNLECNGSPVFTIDIEEAMVNHSETVLVSDGANCSLEVQNATRRENSEPVNADPIWIVDYTIFHGYPETVEDPIEMLTHKSSDSEIVTFERIPDCYFRKLHDFTDIKHMYPGVGQRDEAVEWLLDDDTRNSDCEGQYFIDRYKLVKVMLALHLTENISEKFHCLWQGLICSDSYATTIDLGSKDAFGTIPSEIGLFTSLEELQIYGGIFSGTIPSEIGLLTSLKKLYLRSSGYNYFSGTIPSEIGLLTSLTKLSLLGNEISGTIPTEIGLLANLGELNLGGNELTGTIPSEIGLLTRLTWLDSRANEIQGTLPSEIGMLTALETIYLDRNEISGTIPSEIGLLTALSDLYLDQNKVSGTIPSEIGLMTDLSEFYLDHNEISGTIPSEIGLMTGMIDLYLGFNQISGTIPSEIGLLTRRNFRLWLVGSNYIDCSGVPDFIDCRHTTDAPTISPAPSVTFTPTETSYPYYFWANTDYPSFVAIEV